jgi:hypothetical protein
MDRDMVTLYNMVGLPGILTYMYYMYLSQQEKAQ